MDLPVAHITPVHPTADEVRAGRDLSRGAAHVWGLVHGLALHAHQSQGRGVLPAAGTFHLPAVILAALAGYSERHLYRLADELCAAGLLDARGHVAQVGKLRRYSGTLWSAKLRPDASHPRLRWFDFQHPWRPDFAEDYHGERGAFRDVQDVMSEPFTCEGKTERLEELAKTWVAGGRTTKTAAEGGSDIRPSATLRTVAAALPALLRLHPRQRHQEVSRLAADLAHVLGEPSRFKQHCASIYAALQAQNEGRAGLNYLATQLIRLSVDLAEAAPWRRPGAVLAARLR